MFNNQIGILSGDNVKNIVAYTIKQFCNMSACTCRGMDHSSMAMVLASNFGTTKARNICCSHEYHFHIMLKILCK